MDSCTLLAVRRKFRRPGRDYNCGEKMQCPRCHESAPDGASFCRRCGTALAGTEAVPITIGRDADSTLQINSPRVSSRHASLTPQPDGRFLLRDLGSSNGVFVGSPDNRVKSALVGPDDVVYFADRSFRVAEIVAGLRSGGQDGGPARLRIGREADNDIVIKDESVSRHHAVLERDGQSLWRLVPVAAGGPGLQQRHQGQRPARHPPDSLSRRCRDLRAL